MSPLILQTRLSDNDLKWVRFEVEKYKDRVGDASIQNSKYSGVDKDVRDARIFFPKPKDAPKTFNILQSLVIQHYVSYSLRLTEISEIQYSIYHPGGHFKWHQDIVGANRPGSVENRGLTMSLNLSDPACYEGGELQLKTKTGIIQLDKAPGSLIVFPSFMTHRACEVKSGIRESIVVWIHLPYKEIDYLRELSKKQGIF